MEVYTTEYILENYKIDKKIMINDLTKEQRSLFRNYYTNIYQTLYQRQHALKYKEKNNYYSRKYYNDNKDELIKNKLEKYHHSVSNPLSVINI